ncbi:MAG TPA: 6-bladed beta-propeller [Verrucomicrobiae bacterium]|jgi:sugar lactone lactonase YvrE|nr:6-bladed beta-propeller [Verrucomicrobiae bacterium]
MTRSSKHELLRFTAMLAVLVFSVSVLTPPVHADKKKKKDEPAQPQANILDKIDFSKLVWPNPPAPPRLKYLNYFCCDKVKVESKKKSSWMDRMAGGETQNEKALDNPVFALWTPYGIAVDSKGNVYVADGKVGAIFIFNTETKDLTMIKNGSDARFGDIIGLAIDDSDRLFVSDTKFHRVVVFSKEHKIEGSITQGGLIDPAGMAIDNENRFLYVADAGLDQVLVYDADNLNLLRTIGTAGKKHTLTEEGQFSAPENVALDADNNLYVTDMFNNRVEVFDADGNFIRAWGKAGDRPGYFSRPKGIAIDSDGHVWVADAMQDILQCYTQDGHLLMWMGGHGLFPGQFRDVEGLYIDKNNRIFTSEQYPGRLQMFRYFTDDETRAELAKRKAAADKNSVKPATKPEEKTGAASQAAPASQTSSAAKPQQ